MTEDKRLTHERAMGPGHWSPAKKLELVERLAAYEDLGLSPEMMKEIVGSFKYAGLAPEEFRRLLRLLKPARLLTEADFRDGFADDGGAIPCWKEPKQETRRSGWAVIVYGKWVQDAENGVARYWTHRPDEESRRAAAW